MSSPGFPTLNIDVSARRGERYVAFLAIGLALVGATLLIQQSVVGAAAAACISVFIACVLSRAGWLGGARSIRRLVWQSEGQFLLTNERGDRLTCELGTSSRVTAHAVWLDWVQRGVPPLLLFSGDVPDVDFRRLVVRLRLTAHSDIRGVGDES